MLQLESNYSGGILADDPGLGKTIQTLSLIISSPKDSTTLIVVPTSILEQWVEAAKELVGKRKVCLYHGCKRDRSEFKKAKVVITSYGIAKSETFLQTVNWFRIVLDEVHEIKNRSSKVSKALMAFTSRLRWGLSGTPVHNNKEQLVNLFRFVKGLPADNREPIDLELITTTHLLRRNKETVLKDKIPDINITTEAIPFKDETEQRFYEKVQRNVRSEFKQLAVQCMTASQENVVMFELLLRLRQAAQHPQLVLSGFSKKYKRKLDEWDGVSSKHAALLEFIKQHPEEGSLVFCQFTQEMNILEKYLYDNGMQVTRLDGSVSSSEREAILKDCSKPFKDIKEPRVFLIQIRAGGVGLNLQAYSRVYIMSPDWNPCNEIQAIARSHRLGQQRPVTVKKLVLQHPDSEKSTIDDRICNIQVGKRNLMADLLKEEGLRCNGKRNGATGLTHTDMRRLLR